MGALVQSWEREPDEGDSEQWSHKRMENQLGLGSITYLIVLIVERNYQGSYRSTLQWLRKT